MDRFTDNELSRILAAASQHFYPAILPLARTALQARKAAGCGGAMSR